MTDLSTLPTGTYVFIWSPVSKGFFVNTIISSKEAICHFDSCNPNHKPYNWDHSKSTVYSATPLSTKDFSNLAKTHPELFL